MKKLKEVTRSMSQKVNLGKYNPSLQYETRDYFCSVKFECDEDGYEEASAVASEICMQEIKKSVMELEEKFKEQK